MSNIIYINIPYRMTIGPILMKKIEELSESLEQYDDLPERFECAVKDAEDLLERLIAYEEKCH